MPEPPSNPDLGPMWTVPNMLTLLRLLLVIPIVVLVVKDGSPLWILALVVLAVATDYFDGRIARWSRSESEWGKVLDPLADKVGAVFVVAALAYRGALPLWLLGVVTVRDLLIFGGGILIGRRTGEVPVSLWSGKVATTILALTVLAGLLKADQPVMEACLLASALALGYSFLRYLTRFVRIMRAPGTADTAPASEGADPE